MQSSQWHNVYAQYKSVDSEAATNSCRLGAGTIQRDEQQHQAASRTAMQLIGITIDESSVSPLHGTSLALQAHTCKQEMQSSASGLDLLKVSMVAFTH